MVTTGFRLKGNRMEIFRECRYLYLVPKGHRDYPDGHYGSLSAVSLADARKHLSRWCRGVIIVRADLGEDGCELADNGSQEYRKSLFDAALKADEARLARLRSKRHIRGLLR